MAKQKKVTVPRAKPENGLAKRVETLEKNYKNLELSVKKALDTLAQGVADNVTQVWNNQTEISAALSEMSESTAKALEEVRSAQR